MQRFPPWLAGTLLVLAAATSPAHAQGAAGEADPAVRAAADYATALKRSREAPAALERLGQFRARAVAERHPLAPWFDYWDLGARLPQAQQPDLDAFYARWPGSYVEDRLRNDWLLELGKRRDWANLRAEYLRFRMNDDAEVRCYWLLAEHLDGQDVRAAAHDAWLAQRRDDDGCKLLAATMAQDGRFTPAQLWAGVRKAWDAGRVGAATGTAALIGASAERGVREVADNPLRHLLRQAKTPAHGERAELALLSLLRLTAREPDQALELLTAWEDRLPPSHAAAAWAALARQSAWRQSPKAAEQFRRALQAARSAGDGALEWAPDTLAWAVRSALRSDAPAGERWRMVLAATDEMTPAERAEPSWAYWRARARLALAPRGAEGDEERALAREALAEIAEPLSFYGKLATEDLGRAVRMPPQPPALTAAERAAARAVPGLQRALRLIELGLRSEGVREWNFTLRDIETDRGLLAAAHLACERQVWDRCINTSDRTREQVDLAQRFPTPMRDEVLAKARDAGLDPAYVYGLIRQESRFIMDARSHVGASGLMQLMPATARWTARKLGLDYSPAMITDRDLNLRLGTGYLKMVLDDFEGRMALAAAAYNAGPNRPRRWREGAPLEAAAWVENIPFTETRDYVKKVLSNAVAYGTLIDGTAPSLKARLGGPVGPKPAGSSDNKELP